MTPPSVFVVDDEPSVQMAFIRLLVSAGYEARGFLSARAFLDDYRPVAPGCLILDLQMPDITGLDLLETLRATDPALGVIFVSGHGDVPATAKAMKMGAADFLTKPVDDAVLLGAVASGLAAERRTMDRARGACATARAACSTHAARAQGVRHGCAWPAQQADCVRPRDVRKDNQGAPGPRHAEARRGIGGGTRSIRRSTPRRDASESRHVSAVGSVNDSVAP